MTLQRPASKTLEKNTFRDTISGLEFRTVSFSFQSFADDIVHSILSICTSDRFYKRSGKFVLRRPNRAVRGKNEYEQKLPKRTVIIIVTVSRTE